MIAQQLSGIQALARIRGHGMGWAFSQADFSDLGTRRAIDTELHRLARRGQIRRVLRGVYDFPRYSRVLEKHAGPDIDQIAHAIARKFGWRIQHDGASAQNLLGLSTQVPARVVYLSDGPSRVYRVGKSAIHFEHTLLKEAGFKLRESGLVVQALRAYGKGRIPQKAISRIRSQFPLALRRKILIDTKTATGWIHAAIRQIAKDDNRA
ncbi:MAG: DUF6088 family protein [Bryobacteraceae bacterium]